jgi:hypothetical protein
MVDCIKLTLTLSNAFPCPTALAALELYPLILFPLIHSLFSTFRCFAHPTIIAYCNAAWRRLGIFTAAHSFAEKLSVL